MPFADGDDFGDAGASARAPRLATRHRPPVRLQRGGAGGWLAAVALFGLAGRPLYVRGALPRAGIERDPVRPPRAMPGLGRVARSRDAGEDAYVVDAFVRSRDAFAEILADAGADRRARQA